MTRIAAAAIAVLFLTAAASTQNSQPDPALFSILAGTWGWDDSRKGGTCKTNPHTISISPDMKVARFKQSEPDKNLGTGRTETDWEYAILYAWQNKIMMSMNGETRRTDTGSRVVWILALENKNTYTWSRTDLKAAWGDVLRCDPKP